MNQVIWEAFQQINHSRRAVNYFTDEKISDEDVTAILAEAQLAPSSFNLQPYELHWVKDEELCRQMALACNNKKAASTVSTFIVVVSTYKVLKQNYLDFLSHVENSGLYSDERKEHYRKKEKELKIFWTVFPLKILDLFYELLTIFSPLAVISPMGQNGILNWSIKSAIFAAQNLLLAATARGIDSCPMEGFNTFKVAKILKLKRGFVIPVIVALGKRDETKELKPHWRQSFEKIVKVH